MKNQDFIGELLADLDRYRIANESVAISADEGSSLFPDSVIKYWLSFAVYYERAAVSFVGDWLKSVKEEDALNHFAHQIEDECNHFRWFNKHLSEYGEDFSNFKAPPEWLFLMEDYYPNLETLIERLAAHNIAAETGVLGFLEFAINKFPENIKATVKKVFKDERYHVSFGIKLLKKYCVTEEQKQLARSAALESLKHMQRAREVFVNI